MIFPDEFSQSEITRANDLFDRYNPFGSSVERRQFVESYVESRSKWDRVAMKRAKILTQSQLLGAKDYEVAVNAR